MGREKKVVGPAAARLAQVDYGYDEIHAKAEAVLKKIQVFRKTYCQLLPEPLTGAVDRAEQEWEQVVYILGRRAYP